MNKMQVYSRDGLIIIHFEQKVAWVGLGPSDALALSNLLRDLIK